MSNKLRLPRTGVITGVDDIAHVLDDVCHAVASVWGNERRIVIAIHESFASSQASTITISPPTPTAGVTQEMIDLAQGWATQSLQALVAQAVSEQIVSMPPDDVGNFQVSSLQDIDQQLNLVENQILLMRPQGGLPSLPSLGFSAPFSDPRFCSTSSAQALFVSSVTVAGDFTNTLESVKVQATYGGTAMGASYTFTSNAHRFSAPLNVDIGEFFMLQFSVTYQNSSVLVS